MQNVFPVISSSPHHIVWAQRNGVHQRGNLKQFESIQGNKKKHGIRRNLTTIYH
jgi:hypothetical protein